MINKNDIYIKAAASAKIGTSESNLETNTVYWDSITKCILELPDDFEPVYGDGINFYSQGENRGKITALIEKTTVDGIPFNDKFQITTAKKTTLNMWNVFVVQK